MFFIQHKTRFSSLSYLFGCGGISGKPSSTIGFEKRHNSSLIRDKSQFIDKVTAITLQVPVGISDFIAFNTGKCS